MIEVEGLTYVYPGANEPAVNDVSFAIEPGEIFGLLGPSGAGKSTTQRVLTRQNRRYRGEIRVLSTALEDWDHQYYERIGVTFELPNHYLKLTGRENLDFFASLYQADTRAADELLALVGLEKAADVRVDEYSKGMMMRLNFVRSLLHSPSVLFFDEPTTGLDPVNAGIIKSLISEQRSLGRTILLTTHNMHDVDELCDRVGFIVQGRMNVNEKPETLKARYGKRVVRLEYTANGEDGAREFDFDGLGENQEFLALLKSTEIRTIHSQEASLDRVFADVTGVRLDTEE
ncbi:MAG: ABC transporter ATP-binding protein [Gammaproteobacteria bacterium]|nr:ABC transporter ATP-binding protein [Gammaproteobacteria bacterium]